MRATEAQIGTRVRTLIDLHELLAGTEGIIDQDYGHGVMVAWDLPDQPLPPGYRVYNGKPACAHGQSLRDGFNKINELTMLEVVDHA